MKQNEKRMKQNEKICYKFMFCPQKNVLFDTSCKFKLYDTTHTYFSTQIQKNVNVPHKKFQMRHQLAFPRKMPTILAVPR